MWCWQCGACKFKYLFCPFSRVGKCASGRVGRLDFRKGYSHCWRKDCIGDDGSERSPKKAFSNKKSALLQLVEGTLVPKSIIFCNKIETCRKS